MNKNPSLRTAWFLSKDILYLCHVFKLLGRRLPPPSAAFRRLPPPSAAFRGEGWTKDKDETLKKNEGKIGGEYP